MRMWLKVACYVLVIVYTIATADDPIYRRIRLAWRLRARAADHVRRVVRHIRKA